MSVIASQFISDLNLPYRSTPQGDVGTYQHRKRLDDLCSIASDSEVKDGTQLLLAEALRTCPHPLCGLWDAVVLVFVGLFLRRAHQWLC